MVNRLIRFRCICCTRSHSRILIKLPLSNCSLLQAHLGNVTVNDAMLAQETAKIYSIAVRLVRCLNEYARIKVDCGEAHFRVLVNALTLMKCMNVKMWEDSPMMLIQLPKIGPVRANALVAAQICNFEQLSRTSSMEVEKVCSEKVGKLFNFINVLL